MKLTKSKLKEIIREELLKEASKEKFGLKYDDEDHYVIDDSLTDMGYREGVGYSESWDTYGWKDQRNNYSGAVKEVNALVLKEYTALHKAKAAFEKKADNFWKEKDKIFEKWRKKDGSEQGD